MGAHYINVAPRYTPGSPASVDDRTAMKLARDECENHTFVVEGHEGAERAADAKKRGLALIVFEMIEQSKQWLVLDWITNEMHIWPFFAKCPECGKRFSCSRGWINEHGCPFKFVGYVGRLMNEDERFKYARKFWLDPNNNPFKKSEG